MSAKIKQLVSRRKKLFLAIIIFLVIMAVAVPILVWAQGDPSAQSDPPGSGPPANDSAFGAFFYKAVAYIISIFVELFGELILVLITGLLWIAKFNRFITANAVVIGWVVVRDVCNMFFVLVLLIIAFSTILHQETYNYKKLLPKVLILAILINFSKMICGLAIDAAQVVMMTFVSGFVATGAGNFINATGLPTILKFNTFDNPESVAAGITLSAVAASYTLALIYLIILTIVILVNMVILAFRIVMLWVLTILSPLFFLLLSFPGGTSYAKKWSEQFVKYVITGPLLAFFLWISLSVFGTLREDIGISSGSTGGTNSGGSNQPTAGVTQAGTWDMVTQFVIAIALLVGGLSMTGSMGVAGGGMASNALGKLKSAGTGAIGAGKAGAKKIGHVWDRFAATQSQKGGKYGKVMAILSPTAVKQGWKKRQEELDRRAFPQATGKMQDFFNRNIGARIPFTKAKIGTVEESMHEKIAFETSVAERQREIQASNLNEIQMAQGFMKAKDSGSDLEKLAWARAITATNRQDDVARFLGQNQEWKDKRGHGALVKGGRKGSYTTQGWRQFLHDEYFGGGKQGSAKAANADAMLSHLTEFSESIGKNRSLGLGSADAESGNPVSHDKYKTDGSIDQEATAASMYGEVKARMARGDAEQVMGALETAQVREQLGDKNLQKAGTHLEASEAIGVDADITLEQDSSFGAMTQLGKNIISGITPFLAATLYKSRKPQDRVFRIAGFESDPETGARNADTIDYGKLTDTYKLNPHFVEVLMARSGFGPEELQKVQTRLNARLGEGNEIDFSKSDYKEVRDAANFNGGGQDATQHGPGTTAPAAAAAAAAPPMEELTGNEYPGAEPAAGTPSPRPSGPAGGGGGASLRPEDILAQVRMDPASVDGIVSQIEAEFKNLKIEPRSLPQLKDIAIKIKALKAGGGGAAGGAADPRLTSAIQNFAHRVSSLRTVIQDMKKKQERGKNRT